MDSESIYKAVLEHYGKASKISDHECGSTIATAFGYSNAELADIPKDANLGLSCGNPHAMASIREGETVIDLGSGAGFDVFLAAKRVGQSGLVIGVDMNDEDMLARAESIKRRSNAFNTRFVKSRITEIQLESNIANCVLSNCVINLVPEAEKQLVFNEIFRLLKDGGRVAISDILAKKPLPVDVRKDVALHCGCIAGASLIDEYKGFLSQAGFKNFSITDTHSDLNVYGSVGNYDAAGAIPEQNKAQQVGCVTECCSTIPEPKIKEPGYCFRESDSQKERLNKHRVCADLNEWVGSFIIYAVKYVE